MIPRETFRHTAAAAVAGTITAAVATCVATCAAAIAAAALFLPRKDNLGDANLLAFNSIAVLGFLFSFYRELAKVIATGAACLAAAIGVAAWPARLSSGDRGQQRRRSDETINKTHFSNLLCYFGVW